MQVGFDQYAVHYAFQAASNLIETMCMIAWTGKYQYTLPANEWGMDRWNGLT